MTWIASGIRWSLTVPASDDDHNSAGDLTGRFGQSAFIALILANRGPISWPPSGGAVTIDVVLVVPLLAAGKYVPAESRQSLP
jgi:hypothetical protein